MTVRNVIQSIVFQITEEPLALPIAVDLGRNQERRPAPSSELQNIKILQTELACASLHSTLM